MSHIIIQLHVLTSCDSNSGFFGHGKRKLFEICSKSPEACDFLRNCGNALPITEDIMVDLKAFIVKYVFGDKKSKTISESRALKWKLQKNKSILRLPPEVCLSVWLAIYLPVCIFICLFVFLLVCLSISISVCK